MATPTREDKLVEQKLKTMKESINIALKCYREINPEGSNAVFIKSSYVNKLRSLRACGVHLSDAWQEITRIV